MRRQDSNLRPPGYEHTGLNGKKRRKPRKNRPVFLDLPTIRRRTAQNKSQQICRQEALSIPFFPSPGEIPHSPYSITGEFQPGSWRHEDQQGRRCLMKFPVSPLTSGPPKDRRNITFPFTRSTILPEIKNILL